MEVVDATCILLASSDAVVTGYRLAAFDFPPCASCASQPTSRLSRHANARLNDRFGANVVVAMVPES
jgi:hypothetical protein